MNKKIAVLLLLLSLSPVCALFAEGENLNIKIAVMGPGDELYFWWGHIAMVIEDSETGRSSFYDYGLFSFDNENFFFNFAFGRLLYSCGVSPTDRNLAVYRYTNRSIVMYDLDIPPETRAKVKNFADINVLPENRDYFYHHFKDNCSTRIRDLIDIATDGQFSGQFKDAPGRYTYRQHVRRHTWFSPVMDWALNFWMGQVIDRPVTIWEEMFLPAEVGNRIEDFWYTDVNGVNRKLVISKETLNEAVKRPAVLEVPRKQWPRELVFSICLSLVFGFFFYLQHKNKNAGRILAGISMGFAGFVFGFASLLLYFMNLFTNHDYTFENYNMLFATPLLLAALPLGIYYAVSKNADRLPVYGAWLRLIWLLTVIGILISMFIKLFPPFYQQNQTDQMLMLPIALTFALQPVGLRDVWEKIVLQKIIRRGKK
jgi:hypothetical protein